MPLAPLQRIHTTYFVKLKKTTLLDGSIVRIAKSTLYNTLYKLIEIQRYWLL